MRFTDAVTVNCSWFSTEYVILTGKSLVVMFLACAPSQKLCVLGREHSQPPKGTKETCTQYYACTGLPISL